MAAINEDLLKLIETTTDEKLPEDIFMIPSNRTAYKEGSLWERMSEEQKQQVLDSVNEIDDVAAWVSHDELKSRNSKWLK